ncbi:MAG: polyprenol monophosphomannose synthase [Bdellovibrionales bacterium]
MKNLVIIPTYNEFENISQIVPAIFARETQVHILVVDDNSPDGTQAKVEEMQNSYPNLHLLKRSGKQGLGKAYLAGFDWALKNGYDFVVEMDADFSHRPEDLSSLLRAASTPNVDFVIGSRYVSGGRTENWSWLRKLISRGGSLYSRIILGFPINDWTGGFNGWKAQVLKSIGLETIQSNGYSFQIELKYKASRLKFRSQEVPIVFADRRVGQSKMSLKIVLEAFYRVWLIRL